MRKKLLLLALTSITFAISGCGGGGDSDDDSNATNVATTTTGADKYVGSWRSGCQTFPDSPGVSGIATFSFTKVDTYHMSAIVSAVGYANTTCSGSPRSNTSNSATFTIDGTKEADGHTVDKLSVKTNTASGRDIGFIDGNRLRFGRSSLSSDGYPSLLDSTVYIKQ